MSIYDVNYDQTGPQMLPPDKRYSRMVAWVKTLLKPLQWVRDLWMGSYRTGSTANPWVGSSTYAKYDRILYKQKVYESLIGGNTASPTDQTAWMVVQQNFIGVFERVLYTGNKLIFEYAINKYFGAVFRQPPNLSDIYISVNEKPFSVFVVGGIEGNSSIVYSNTSSEFVINAYDFNTFFNMTLMVPAVLYAALDPNAANAEKIIRNYANQYIVAGIIYNVQTY
ncbi:hypothetical protein F0L74_09805 [Chitinophaga agrisoli]|uniref:Uncharacterized protein n=1 Tax=Chitinophaga agrisoli TaxID=2607653 RepID=A0A5B2VSR0_9BACT|nr:hypothetical protein [Chitinophaga agrisoli]KAA2242813.1 hypothetical protein F0L74_09805 [Chitinophaga agrisoli]